MVFRESAVVVVYTVICGASTFQTIYSRSYNARGEKLVNVHVFTNWLMACSQRLPTGILCLNNVISLVMYILWKVSVDGAFDEAEANK